MKKILFTVAVEFPDGIGSQPKIETDAFYKCKSSIYGDIPSHMGSDAASELGFDLFEEDPDTAEDCRVFNAMKTRAIFTGGSQSSDIYAINMDINDDFFETFNRDGLNNLLSSKQVDGTLTDFLKSAKV